jgi:hypothetical protein
MLDPLISVIDIWRCAGVMIKRYADQADIEAAKRAYEFEVKAERDGQHVWLRILRAIDAVQNLQSAETRH